MITAPGAKRSLLSVTVLRGVPGTAALVSAFRGAASMVAPKPAELLIFEFEITTWP